MQFLFSLFDNRVKRKWIFLLTGSFVFIYPLHRDRLYTFGFRADRLVDHLWSAAVRVGPLFICTENPVIPVRIQMERFISVEIFREKGNTCRRNDRNFLYQLVHLFGSNSLFWCGKKNYRYHLPSLSENFHWKGSFMKFVLSYAFGSSWY